MPGLLADSNWLIRLQHEVLHGVEGPAARLIRGQKVHINIISQAEFRSHGLTPEIEDILSRCVRLKPLSYEDANLAAAIRDQRRRAGKTLHLPDALMAAHAMRRHLRLITADKDFSGIPGLKWSNYPH
jgi:predicted nucleic acid-binding protein